MDQDLFTDPSEPHVLTIALRLHRAPPGATIAPLIRTISNHMRASTTRIYHKGTGIPRPIAVDIHAHGHGVRTLRVRLGLALLGVVYAIAAGLGAHTVTGSGCGGADSSTIAYSHFGPSGLLLHHAPAKEGLAKPYSAPPATSAKDRTTGFTAIVQAQHHTVRVAFVRPIIVARSMLTALRRCALLFPFHHFW